MTGMWELLVFRQNDLKKEEYLVRFNSEKNNEKKEKENGVEQNDAKRFSTRSAPIEKALKDWKIAGKAIFHHGVEQNDAKRYKTKNSPQK